ncbi:MAG: CAP domain-containing protein [Flavobacteriaceae bacterium]
MKKLFYTLWIIASAIGVSMCSKTSSFEEEQRFTESLFEGEKVVVDSAQMEKDLFDLVNDHRTSIGFSKLQSSSTSYKYAQEHNNYMISKNKLSHDNFESRASGIASEINAVDVSENVARFYSTAELTLDGWLKSNSHKEAIEGDYTHATLSVQLDKEGLPYFTQIFMKVE